MTSSFATTNGTTWVVQEPPSDFDPSKVVSITIRKFKHLDTEYTIQACAGLSFPLQVFYHLQVKNENEHARVSSSNSYRDFRMLKNILKRQPIEVDQYKVFQRKLHRKVVERKLELYNEQKNLSTNNSNAVLPVCPKSRLERPSDILYRNFPWPNSNRKEMSDSQMVLFNIADSYFDNAGDFDEEQMQIIGVWCLRLTNLMDKTSNYPMKNYYIALDKLTSYFTSCMERKKHLEKRSYDIVDATRYLALNLITDKYHRQSMLKSKWETEYLFGHDLHAGTVVTNGYKRLRRIDFSTTSHESDDRYNGGILGLYARGDTEIEEGFFPSGPGGKIGIDCLL